MLSVIQRVQSARVEVQGAVVGEIQNGLAVLVCAQPNDTIDVARAMVDRLLRMRLFSDAQGKMNLSLTDVQGGLLLVSQFTLAADVRKGTRPGFSGAAKPDEAKAWYDALLNEARARHPNVAAGVFGANMQLHLINDGPVTIPFSLP